MWHSVRDLWHRLVARRGNGAASGRGAERRQWPRFVSEKEARCRPAVDADAEPVAARVCNVSAGGINLLALSGFPEGSLLHVGLPADGAKELLACVVQVRAPAEESWSLGCSFIRELTEQELCAFL